MVNSNVAGSKLGQDSIQNIFENQQKQAYADYLDRMPKAGQTAAEKYRTPLPGADGFYWDYDTENKQWYKTSIPVTEKVGTHGTGSPPYAPVIVMGPNGPEVQAFNKGQGTVKPTVPAGQAPPVAAEAARKAAETQAKEDKRVVELDATIQGLKIDRDSKDRKKFEASTQSHINEFNEKASTPYVYVMDEVTTPSWGGLSKDTVIKPVKRDLPPGLDAASATKAYKVFLKNGRTGTFDNFIYEVQQGTIKIK